MLTRTSLTNAARWIETHPLYGFGAFAILHFSIWTILPALLYPNLPLDIIEGLAYGREWQLGYDKLPPLPGWLVEMARLAAGHDVAYYMLAQVATITSFVFVFATTSRLVGPFGAFLSILIIDGVQYFNFSSVKFNHNVIELPFWALAGFAFHAALRRGRNLDWILLGSAVGMALWAKYFVLVLALPLVLFLLSDGEARPTLRTPGPWLALVTALAVAGPHLAWLISNDFLPLQYVEARAAPSRGFIDHLLRPLQAIGLQLPSLLPALLIAAPLGWSLKKAVTRGEAFDRRIVILLAFAPTATLALISMLTGRATIAPWGFPLWLFFGTWRVSASGEKINGERARLAISLWFGVFVVYVLAFIADYTVLPSIDHRYRATFYPGEQLAVEVTNRFHAATGRSLSYIIGDIWHGGNIAHYSPDRPRLLVDGNPRRSPWIDPSDLRARGAVAVWAAGDGVEPPAAHRQLAAELVVQAPITLPMRAGGGKVVIGWAILHPVP
jgi:4-amino-4-deoxy-L-arabinose transferase-like glycosyltransferase